jgi:hypothetical protein
LVTSVYPRAMVISISTPRLLTFLQAEWHYHDGIEDPEPGRITVIDILAPVMVNAYGGAGANRLHGVYEGLVKSVEPMLAQIPADADLRDYDPGSPQLRELFEAAVSIKGVLVPVATKVLHRKRRRLIPMLDNVVLAHYLKVGGPDKLPWRTQDKARAAQVAVEVLSLFREDLIACYEPLSALSSMAAEAGRPVTPLRILELLIWSEVEPKGYYRV